MQDAKLQLSPADVARLKALAAALVLEAIQTSRHVTAQVDDSRRWTRRARLRGLELFQEAHNAPNVKKSGVRRSLAVGELHGELENVVFALLAPDAEALAVHQAALGGPDNSLVDHMAASLVAPTASAPLRALTLRWRRPAPRVHVFGRRSVPDSLVLVASGLAHLADGERVGYELQHTLEPSPGRVSSCCVFRQRGPEVVEVVAIGSPSTVSSRASLRRLLALEPLGRRRKLAWLLANAQPPKLSISRPPRCCAVCFRAFPGRFLPHRRPKECSACGAFMCGGCAVTQSLLLGVPGSAGGWTAARRSLPFCGRCVERADDASALAVAACDVDDCCRLSATRSWSSSLEAEEVAVLPEPKWGELLDSDRSGCEWLSSSDELDVWTMETLAVAELEGDAVQI